MGRLVERRNDIYVKGVWVSLRLLLCTVLMAPKAGLSSHPMTLHKQALTASRDKVS